MRQAGRNGQGGQGGNMSEMCSNWLKNMPIVTVVVITVCFLIYLYSAFQDGAFLLQYAICADKVLDDGEWSRWLSSNFFHASFFHVFFNMMFMGCLGGKVELGMGTIPFLGINSALCFLTNLVYIFVSWALYAMSPDDFSDMYFRSCAVGYSGVLFGLLVVDCQNTPDVDRVFCCCPIPAWIYPWVLFLLIQLSLPDVSWLGHLGLFVSVYLYP
jgi:rhomboid domain-containing protein 1